MALAAAVISILVKEGLFWYTRFAAKQINSISLMAEAWHHRSDALSSIGSFIGIFGARLGYPVLDPVASVVKFFSAFFLILLRKPLSESTHLSSLLGIDCRK